jgi:hypothetical protein
MNIWDIVKTVGSGVLATMPGGPLVLGAVNALLPDDQKLPETATGQQIGDAVATLPPEARAELLNKEFEVDITQIKESHSTVRVMLESDAKNPHSTRPYIAKHSFHVIAFAVVVAVSIWGYGVWTKDSTLVKAVVDGWPFILAVIGPFVILLRAYFGVLKNEHKNRLDAAGGKSTPSGIAGIISALTTRN